MAQFARPTPATALIVEHEALIRMELVSGLRDMGWSALEARNADEALLTLEEHPEVELILTHLRIPGSMDGVRLARNVSKHYPTVRIIVASGWIGNLGEELPSESVILSKPYSPDALAAAVRSTMH